MRNILVSVIRTTFAACALFGADAVLHGRPAHALSVSWSQDSTLQGYVGGPGCATQISVGQDNAPWVLGCSGPGDNGANKSIYQLVFAPCGSNCFGGTYQWAYMNGAAVQLFVDSDPYDGPTRYSSFYRADALTTFSQALAVTSDGHVWAGGFLGWIDVTVNNNDILPGPFGNGCLTSIVPSLLTGPATGSFTHTLYGFGCSSAPDIPIYSATVNTSVGNYPVAYNSYSGWTRVDGQDNAAATKMVLFTGTTSGQPYGLLVVLNSQGHVYVLNPFTSAFQQIPASPVTEITDHFVIATEQGSQGPYSVLYQYSDTSNSWLRYSDGSLTTPNGTQITHLAFSNYGPSSLWGLDTNNNIFTASNSIVPR